MRLSFITLFFLSIVTSTYGQNKVLTEIENIENRQYYKAGTRLDDIFSIDQIVKVIITNNKGVHILTKKELAAFRLLLKRTISSGGLHVKPTHITIQFVLKKKKNNFAYGTTGFIHFDPGTDKKNNAFAGTFQLPKKLNFDNY